MDPRFDQLPETQRRALAAGRINTVHDLLFTPMQDLSKRCRMPPAEFSRIIDTILSTSTQSVNVPLMDACSHTVFTTGDVGLDRALGGGIRTGMVLEVTGESAAGKTQFALQTSLMVQLPSSAGGASGSSCYLTTKSNLQTGRLVEILDTHPIASSSSCTLDDIHTMKMPTSHRLIEVLQEAVPLLITRLDADPSRKPVRLLILDAITELFHQSERTSSDSLKERSRLINDISKSLHTLASRHSIAIVVLNEVIDSINHHNPELPDALRGEVAYKDQSPFFNSAEAYPRKEAGLGLTWANQVNIRILFSRTHRRRHLDHDSVPQPRKRPRLNEGATQSSQRSSQPDDDTTLIRQLSVIFSPLAPTISLDYIVTEAGISTLPGEVAPETAPTREPPRPAPVHPTAQSRDDTPITLALPSSLDGGILADNSHGDAPVELVDPEDEFDDLWRSDEQFFGQLDFSTIDAAAGQPSSQITRNEDVQDFVPSSQLSADGLT